MIKGRYSSFLLIKSTFNVDPLGPIRRCLLFTNLSLFLTKEPILMMSHATSSWRIRTAFEKIKKIFQQYSLQIPFFSKPTLLPKDNNKNCIKERREGGRQCCMMSLMLAQIKQNLWNYKFTCSNETLLANSFMRSLALMMIYGSKVFFVVQTVMLPSIRSKVALTCCKK